MFARVLGSAAGGGFPQWNCGCSTCDEARRDPAAAVPRTMCSVAVSADGRRWLLVNASPDVGRQVHATPALWPPPGTRDTPVAGVVLTDAELDHVLGLLSLREARGLPLYGTPAVREALRTSGLLGVLGAYTTPVWTDMLPGQSFTFGDGGLVVEPIEVASGLAPRYAGTAGSAPPGGVVGLRITDRGGGGPVVLLPSVATLGDGLLAALDGAVALVDGTYWSDDESGAISSARPALAPTARRHVPMTGPGGSLDALTGCGARRIIFTHLNNTNPVLREGSPERAELVGRGFEIAHDGLVIEA